jgi:tetratricopeptide (TPR) repeat protein
VNESRIFLAAAGLTTPAERSAYLDETCHGDHDLRRAVDALLRAHESDPDFLERPAVLDDETLPFSPGGFNEFPPDRRIERAGVVFAGRYELIEPLGEGGMGTVWLARQTEPVKRPVAVKLVKPGMDSAAVLARFEAERQALALMDHPNIAKVLDAGTAPDGRPFFVMEYVAGTPITRYCDEHRLSLDDRLDLFARVCDAVHHAHQKSVVHRDLKPSNVLVSRADGRAVPKVIDFGVAKAIGGQLTEETLRTDLGTVIGTPEYMSPEQASLGATDVDTRSDVYSLGVLSYELLAGAPPFARAATAGVGLLEILRAIREEVPPRPSTKRRSRPVTTPSGPTADGSKEFGRALRTELDWVVMKALEKDRGRRYESAAAFGADVRRYLAGEPVLAVPPTRGYRVRTFARRNRRALVTAAVVGLFFVGSLAAVIGSIGWAVRDQAARAAESKRDVDRELENAGRLRDQGDRAGARIAVKQVARLLATDGTADQTARLALIVKDLDMLDRLVVIALRTPDTPSYPAQLISNTRACGTYTTAFRDYGIDVEALDADTAARIVRESPIRVQLVAGLEDWMWCEYCKGFPWHVWTEKRGKPQYFFTYEHLRTVADRSIPNEWAARIRGSVWPVEKSALVELARHPEVATLPSSNLLLLSRLMCDAGAVDKAVDVLYALQRRKPHDVTVNFELSILLAQRVRPARPEEAIGYARSAIAVRPDLFILHSALGHYLSNAKKPDQAIDEYRTAIALQPSDPYLSHSLGRAYAEKAKLRADAWDWPAAIDAYTQAIALGVMEWRGRGSCYTRMGMWNEAIDDLTKAVEQSPNDGLAWFDLATSLIEIGDRKRYRETCTAGLEQFRTGPASWDAYLFVRACGLAPDSVDDLKAVVQLAERCADTNKKAGYYHALGSALFRAGDARGAIDQLKKSRSLDESWDAQNGANGMIMAMAYFRIGNTSEAERELNATIARLEKGRATTPAPKTFPLHSIEWHSTQILRREAENMILGTTK